MNNLMCPMMKQLCCEDKCAWWDGDRCSIVSLAGACSDIQEVAGDLEVIADNIHDLPLGLTR